MPMHYEVTITDAALSDIRRIHERLAMVAIYPLYPEKIRDELVAAIESLVVFPKRGIPRRNGSRVLMTGSRYNVVYQVNAASVTVFRIRHQRQRRAS